MQRVGVLAAHDRLGGGADIADRQRGVVGPVDDPQLTLDVGIEIQIAGPQQAVVGVGDHADLDAAKQRGVFGRNLGSGTAHHARHGHHKGQEG